MSNPILNSLQVAEKSILDLNGRQIYLGNGFVANTGSISIASASTETPILSLGNPSSNNTPTSMAAFNFMRKLIVTTASQNAVFNFYKNPTITGAGTSLDAINLRSGSTNTSLMTAKKSPTTSVNGTLICSLFSAQYAIDNSLLYILDPGDTLLVTATVSGNATNVILELGWYEI